MKINPIQFAVVREDPFIEAELVRAIGARNIFLIGSGGCTALTLQALFPALELTLLDPNPTQLQLIKKKIEKLTSLTGEERNKAFGIGFEGDTGLNTCGNFESLFRSFRNFVYEFVLPREEFLKAFGSDDLLQKITSQVFTHKFWPVAFDLFFSDSILNTMFGPDATQHAPKGSYPGYFRKVVEGGLQKAGASQYYFLHHIFLGHYLDRPGCLPPYLTLSPPSNFRFEFVQKTIQEIKDFSHFDLIALSNIFDWMPEEVVRRTAGQIRRSARPGAVLIYRQLNHSKDFQKLFGPDFAFDGALEEKFLKKDQSLFYSKLNIGTMR